VQYKRTLLKSLRPTEIGNSGELPAMFQLGSTEETKFNTAKENTGYTEFNMNKYFLLE